MTKQEPHDQPPQGGVTGRAGYPGRVLIAPADFFRMSPFTLMRRMGEEMERVLGEFGMHHGETAAPVWAPAIEVSQTGGKYLVRAELPGVNPGDVKLEVTGDAIVLEGERKIEKDENKDGVYLTERRYGRFYRAIPLPEQAMVDEAKAKFENGVIEVTVPVQAKKENRRQIPIESVAPAPPGTATQAVTAQSGSAGKAA